MPNLLSNLLAADEPHLSLCIRQLELSSGHTGMDVRLMSDIIEKTHAVTKKLGLDSNDTTGEELFHSLINKIQSQDINLVKQLGGSDSSDV